MTKIQLRRDTLVNFTSKNPILAEGELAYETDTKKLKIGDGTTAYTQLEYFSAGGGGSTNISATLPLKIVDGVISLEVDGQTIQIVDGKLHANLDELGNEVNTLSGRVTAVEADILSKQDKFTPASPLDIKNVASVSLRDVTISGDNLSFGNNNLLTGQVRTGISTSSTFAQSIQTGIVIPYKFGQVLQFHCGNDTYVQGSNRRHGSPCVALFGHFNGSGDFVTALAINGFASYTSSNIRGNMGGALKSGAVSMLPNKTYLTTTAEKSVERGENTINMGTDYSTYIQLMVNDAGNLMQGIYGHYGTNSTNDGWGAMARTDVIQDRSLNSGQTVADIIAAIDTAVIIKGSNFGTIKKANFGLYNYNERLPWTQAGYDSFIANKGDNLIDLDNPSIQPQLQLNIGDGLSVVDGKLTASSTAPSNMVTTDTAQEITGSKLFSNGLKVGGYAGISDNNGEQFICVDPSHNGWTIGNQNSDGWFSNVHIKRGASGDYINIDSGNISEYILDNLPTATNSSKGIVKPDGTSITVSSDGTISATATGGGDVTAAGDNTFTGKNTFSNQIIIPSDFNGVKGICIDGQSNASIYATGDYLNLRNVGQLSGGSGSDLVIGTETQKTQIRGSSVVDKHSKTFLTQGNVTAGDNVTITDTTDGIQISATGGGSNLRYPVEVSDKSLMPSWYVVYNDGWIEQGGKSGATANVVNVTLLKSFTNTNYSIIGSISGSNETLNIPSSVNDKLVNSFKFYVMKTGGEAYWEAYGY